jgi:toxin ParE1/3/4
MRIRYTATALREIDDILFYIAERNQTAAVALRARVDKTVAALLDFPDMAQAADEPGVRRIPIGRSPYIIYYAVEGDEIVILHTRHGARRPLYEDKPYGS